MPSNYWQGERASDMRTGDAIRARASSLESLTSLIKVYILVAARAQGCQPADVPCPDIATWKSLVPDRNTPLPEPAKLSMYATDELRAAAKSLPGGLCEAYFVKAQREIADERGQRMQTG